MEEGLVVEGAQDQCPGPHGRDRTSERRGDERFRYREGAGM
jgi:hypothetical protein